MDAILKEKNDELVQLKQELYTNKGLSNKERQQLDEKIEKKFEEILSLERIVSLKLKVC